MRSLSCDKTLVCIILIRIIFGLVSSSWYVPDETWQSVEVSHRLVFGTGYITWEWTERIRSSLHPILFSIPMFILKTFNLDSQYLIVLLPRLVQGCLTGVCEYMLYNVIKCTEGDSTGSWFIILTLFNWHILYSASRTLINTAEYALTSLALSFYISSDKNFVLKSCYSFLPVVGLLFMLRPTSALIWAPLCLLRLPCIHRWSNVVNLLKWTGISLLVVGICILVDSWFYATFTITPLNFFIINVYRNLGVNYGSHPWHWYVSNALPSAFGPLLIAYLLELKTCSIFQLLPVAVNITFLSILPHKELRFLQSSFPFLILVMSKHLTNYSLSTQRFMKYLFLSTNLVLAVYLSTVHQRGVNDAALWIGRRGLDSMKSGREESVLFLMPCHSTPLYSHIHHNVSTRFLHCEPNLSGLEDYLEEADEFYADPAGWLDRRETRPTLLVFFESLTSAVSNFLKNYELCASFFHSHFPEGRIGANVVVYCRK